MNNLLNAELPTILNKFWGSEVEKLNIDISSHLISLELIVIENKGTKSSYKISFEGVASYSYVNKFARLDNEPWDYIELTSIDFYEKGLGKGGINSQVAEEWVQQYDWFPNFALEFWNSMMFVEASRITINDLIFQVKTEKQ